MYHSSMQGAWTTGGNSQGYYQESQRCNNSGEHYSVNNYVETRGFRPRPLTIFSRTNLNNRSHAQGCKGRSNDLTNSVSNNVFLNQNPNWVQPNTEDVSDDWTVVKRKNNAYHRKIKFSESATKNVRQPGHDSTYQPLSRPITVYYPRPWLSKVLSETSSLKVDSVNKKTLTKKPEPNFLPQPLFNVAKTMCSILKATHHLFQVEGVNVPKQISKQASLLKSFPKPFAPNESIKKCIVEIADQWSKNLCKNLRAHYESVRLSNLVLLENVSECSDNEWDSCMNLALKWTRSSFKNFSDSELKEGRDSICSARRKQKEVYRDTVVSSPSAAPLTEPVKVSNIAEVPTEHTIVSEELEVEKSLPLLKSKNSLSFEKLGKKLWIIPESFEEKKLLITDENFVGPVSLDFFHVTLPNCSVWDLYNVVRNSVLPKDLSLILVHVGYKTKFQHNLNYLKTIADKIKVVCPNAKLFFTSLVSKSVDGDIARFNNWCKQEFSDFFIDCDLREVSFTTVEDKSEKLFAEWIKILISLN